MQFTTTRLSTLRSLILTIQCISPDANVTFTHNGIVIEGEAKDFGRYTALFKVADTDQYNASGIPATSLPLKMGLDIKALAAKVRTIPSGVGHIARFQLETKELEKRIPYLTFVRWSDTQSTTHKIPMKRIFDYPIHKSKPTITATLFMSTLVSLVKQHLDSPVFSITIDPCQDTVRFTGTKGENSFTSNCTIKSQSNSPTIYHSMEFNMSAIKLITKSTHLHKENVQIGFDQTEGDPSFHLKFDTVTFVLTPLAIVLPTTINRSIKAKDEPIFKQLTPTIKRKKGTKRKIIKVEVPPMKRLRLDEDTRLSQKCVDCNLYIDDFDPKDPTRCLTCAVTTDQDAKLSPEWVVKKPSTN